MKKSALEMNTVITTLLVLVALALLIILIIGIRNAGDSIFGQMDNALK